MNPLVLALLSAAMWGCTDLVTTYVGRRIGSLRVVVIAVTTSLLLAGGVAIARGALTTEYDATIVGGTLLLGVAAGIAYIGVFTAFRLGPLSVVSPTVSAYGALAAFLAVIFLNEHLTAAHVGGVVAVGVGISLLGLQTTGTGRDRRASLASPGVAFALVGLLFFAIITVLLTIPIKAYGWSTAIALSRLGNIVTVWLIFLVLYRYRSRLPKWGRHDLLGEGQRLDRIGFALAALVGIGDTVAFFIFAAALEQGPTWAVSLLSSLGPIIVVLGGLFGYRERLRRPQVLGLGALAVGLVLATLPS
ncbi:MAG: DMT family transporter [bacterium]|nr:DMT family transporter [Candidatus Aquidulcis sp.]